MSDDQPPIYAGFVTRATGLIVDEVLILVIGVAGVIVGKAIYEGRFGVDEAVLTCAR